ncbi:uncharacterized protein C7orf57 homolog [Gastrophryne carolinensis]
MRQKESSAATSRYSTCDWFYHAPLKQTDKRSEMALPPTSQIPGLSDLAEPHNELIPGGRKKWIRDTDSEYVKLAKQGGRPDLLKQVSPPQKKTTPTSYAPPDWYVHEDLPATSQSSVAPQRNMPDYMIHEEFIEDKSEQKYEENEKENQDDKKVKLPAIYPNLKQDNNIFAGGKGPPLTNTKHGKKCVFPPMPRNNAVNFGKLLSNGYGDEWYVQHDQDKKFPPKSKLVSSKE